MTRPLRSLVPQLSTSKVLLAPCGPVYHCCGSFVHACDRPSGWQTHGHSSCSAGADTHSCLVECRTGRVAARLPLRVCPDAMLPAGEGAASDALPPQPSACWGTPTQLLLRVAQVRCWQRWRGASHCCVLPLHVVFCCPAALPASLLCVSRCWAALYRRAKHLLDALVV
jgi:hypothetical protein